jgi:hypothetical protein
MAIGDDIVESDFGTTDFEDVAWMDLLLSPSTAGIDTTAIESIDPQPEEFPVFNYEPTPDYSADQNQVLSSDPTTWPPELQAQWLMGGIDGAQAGELAVQAPVFQQQVAAAQQAGLEALQAAGISPDTVGMGPGGELYVMGPDGQWQPLDPNAVPPEEQIRSTSEAVRNYQSAIAAGMTPEEAALQAGGGPAPQTWGQILSGAFGALNSVLSTPAGKMLAGLGIGGASIGLSQALTDVAKVKAPALPTAATATQAIGLGQGALVNAYQQGGQADLTAAYRGGLAGEKSLADLLNLQAGQELAAQTGEQPLTTPIRMGALGQIPGQMNATTNPNIVGTGQVGQAANTVAGGLIPGAGEIGAGIGQQIRNVLSGNYSNPILENNIKRRREEFEAKQYAMLGPGWQTSTPGMQAQEQQDLLEEQLRFEDQQKTIASYTPLYNTIIQNQANIGQGATSQIQGAQQQGISQNVALSQFGRTPPSNLASNLGTITPPTSLAALPAAATTVSQIGSQAFDASRINAANENAANQSLASGIGSMGGAIAGGLLRNSIAAG